MRNKSCILVLLMAGLLLACNRSVSGSQGITTPAVNTLIAAGTKPAPLDQSITPFSTQVTPSSPESSLILTGTAEPAPTRMPIAQEKMASVILLSDIDLLNVRVEPGLSGPVLLTLPPQQRDLKPTGQQEESDDVSWVEINLPDGGTGWVSGEFLTEQVDPAFFCQDPQVDSLIDRLILAVKERDGEILSGLASPRHGLALHQNVMNPPVSFTRIEVLQKLFISTEDYDWSGQEGIDPLAVGTFKDLVYPKLQDVLSYSHTRHCNVLEQDVSYGGTSGQVFWPSEYANWSFVALYRAAPSGQEMNWRTWVVGIEYVDGVPYIAVLLQFYWEI